MTWSNLLSKSSSLLAITTPRRNGSPIMCEALPLVHLQISHLAVSWTDPHHQQNRPFEYTCEAGTSCRSICHFILADTESAILTCAGTATPEGLHCFPCTLGALRKLPGARAHLPQRRIQPSLCAPQICACCVAGTKPRTPRGRGTEAWMQPNSWILALPPPPWASMPPGPLTLPSSSCPPLSQNCLCTSQGRLAHERSSTALIKQ